MTLRLRTIAQACFSICILSLLGACGETITEPNPNSEPLSTVAVVFAEDTSPGPTGSSPYLSVITARLIEAKSVDQILSTTLASYTQIQGTCSSRAGLNFNANDPFGLGDFDVLNAGDVITVQNGGNTYAELPANASEYSWEANEAGAFPQNLVMNIPGSEFPAIENIAIPNLSDIDVVLQDSYEAGNTLQWQASDESELPLWIVLNFGSQICFEADDGSFELPDTPTDINNILTIRRAVSVYREIDTLVVMVRTKEWQN